MRISLLCSDNRHPVNRFLEQWKLENDGHHQIEIVRKKSDLSGGEILFLISCTEIINEQDRSKYSKCLVLHASDLPRGRGWSPHIWQIIGGAELITLSLLEAADKVDSGPIWLKSKVFLPRHALWDEINARLFEAEIVLIDQAIKEIDLIKPVEQSETVEPSYYRRRCPEDSKIDAYKSIASQFDIIRVCDPNRFPAYFEIHGNKFKLTLERVDE